MIGGPDYAVIIAYFVILITVGLLASRKAKSKEDYLVAGRQLPLPMFTACMAAVVIGGGATLGGAEVAYSNGISGIWLGAMYAVSIFLLGMLVTTKMSNMRILSTNEAVGIFYGPYARVVSALVTLIYLFMIAVLQIVGIGTILHTMMGWPVQISMVAGGVIIIAYLLLGGMLAVAFTDIFQFIIMTLGIIIIGPICALAHVGGFSGLSETLPESYFNITAIGFDRILAYVLLFVPGFLVGQDIWQKAFTAKTPKIAKRGTLLASGYILLYAIGTVILGICLYAANPNLADPKLAFATASVTFVPAGMKGLLLAAALAAIMSTANGGILGAATVIYNDLLKSKLPPSDNPKRDITVNRVLVAVVCALSVVCALWLQSVLVALDVAYAYLSGCVFVPLVCAFLLKKISGRAGFYALCASFLTVTGFFIKDGITALSPIKYGILVSVVVFFLVHFLDNRKKAVKFKEGEEIFME